MSVLQLDVAGVERPRSAQTGTSCVSNHQSWVDILVLQKVFNRRIPFLKFFLKQELIWVPLLGLAWWALEFPFMRRHSSAYLAAAPGGPRPGPRRHAQGLRALRAASRRR